MYETDIFFNLIIFVHFTCQTSSLPSSCFSPPPPIYPHPLLRKGKASCRESTRPGTFCWGRAKTPTPIKAEQGIPPYGMSFKKSAHAPGIDSCLTAGGPTNRPGNKTISPACRGTSSIPCRLYSCWSGVCELPQVWVIYLCGFPHSHDLDSPLLL